MDINSIMSQMGAGAGSPGGMSGGGGPPSMSGPGGMPPGGPSQGPPQAPPMDNSPQQGILQKMSGILQKSGPSSESKKIQNIVVALKSLDQLANELEGQDPANTQAVRMMIRILGEILKSSQQEQQIASNMSQPNVMGNVG